MTYYENYDMSQPLADPRLELAVVRLAADDAELGAELHVKINRMLGAISKIDGLEARISELEAALELALCWLGKLEPGDSRAVSNEYVAMFSILAKNSNDECMPIIRAALAVEAA